MSCVMVHVLKGTLRLIGEQLTQLPSGPKPEFKDEENWKLLDENTMAHNATQFLISCGTITLRDGFRNNQGPPEVLVTCVPHLNNAYMLPKGCKDIHADNLWQAASRETEEEATVSVKPLHLKSFTRFTVPDKKAVGKDKTVVPKDTKDSKDPRDINEIIGKDIVFSYAEVEQKYKAIRYVFLYPAQAASEINYDKLVQSDKKNKVEWLPIDEAIEKLKMRVEREAIMRMKTLLEGMTDEDWKVSDAVSGQTA